MSFLQGIVDFIESSGVGEQGRDLFRGHMPDTVVEGLLVISQTPIPINPYSTVRDGSFQVIARSTDGDSAASLLESVSDMLRVSGKTVGNVYFHYINPRHEPLIYPRSEGDLIEASVNFDFSFIKLT